MKIDKNILKKSKMTLIFFLLSFNVVIFLNLINTTSGAEEWENANLQWYYDNLTDEDRKKIRQAIDYCIPRQQVIDGLMKGYAIPLATEIGSNMLGYDLTIQPRSYSTSNALDLLTEVFGKRYNVNEDPSEVYTNVPYFKMTLTVPTTNTARSQWAALIALSLNNVGIKTNLEWWNWNIIMPRIFLDPSEPTGASYDQGGWDGFFVGFGTTVDLDLSGQYYNDSFVPAGDNFMYVERADLQEIIKRSLESPLEADRLQALKDYQAWFYEWVPKSIIRQGLAVFPQDPELTGFDPYLYGRYPWVHSLSHPTQTTFTSIVPGDFFDFNPLVSNSWYDSVPMSNCFLSLAARRGINDLSPYPLLANSWSSTSDGKNWTVNLKEGVKFEDGSEVTAQDVVETYRVAMNASTSTSSGDMMTWFASDQDIYAEGNYVVHMNLQIFYPYVTSQIFGLPIMKADQLRSIGIDNLKTDATNTGAVGLISNGPYKVSAYSTNTLTLIANDQYDGMLLGHNPGDNIFLEPTGSIDTYICTIVKEATAAVTELATGGCDLLDPNQGVFGYIEDLEDNPEWAKIVTYPEYGWQELALNHYDPRWGLNPHDPAEMYPEPTTETTTEEPETTTTTTSNPETTQPSTEIETTTIEDQTTTETEVITTNTEQTTTETEAITTNTEQTTTEPTETITPLITPGFEYALFTLSIAVVISLRPLIKKRKEK